MESSVALRSAATAASNAATSALTFVTLLEYSSSLSAPARTLWFEKPR
jgi:hypothetical protein